ncbi:MAG: toll/interleukin-1 receptor domain-containing protein [Actinomycetaceae bacterium]|nr:toll/interleukin-1 receptor domain-containing protein [Actinomycetaceae bacterium]
MFKYDAFVSYRHVQPDTQIAQQVQNLIESYRVSKAVEDVDKRGDFVVFRDRDELPAGELGQAIERALETSRYLIVVCSRRTPDSPWCRREIEYFLRVRDASHIIAVLVEGEPEESFPPELRDATKAVVTSDGIQWVRKGELLAADVRPEEVTSADFAGYEHIEDDEQAMDRLRKKSLAILKKTEIHRIMATILGVSYGDITQRQRERRMRRIIAASTAVSLALSVFGVVITGLWLKAQRERRAANEKNAVITMSLASNMIDEGDRVRGLLYLRAAMDLANEDMDGYANLEGEYQKNLSAALLYEDFTPVVEIEPSSDIATFGINVEGDEVATAGDGAELTVWSADNGEEMRSIRLPGVPSKVGDSLDGATYWALGPGGDIYLVPSDGKDIRTVETGVTEDIKDVKVQGDRALLLTGDELSSTVVGVDVRTGRKVFDTADVAAGRTLTDIAVRSDGREFALAFDGGGAVRVDAITGEAIGWIVEPEADDSAQRTGNNGVLGYAGSGKALVYMSGTNLYRADTATGYVETTTSQGFHFNLSNVFLTDDAQSIFVVSDSSYVQRERFDDGSREFLSSSYGGGDRVLQGALSPEGSSFAALLEDNSIAQWRAGDDGAFSPSSLETSTHNTGKVSTSNYANTGPLGSPIASIRYSRDGARLFARGTDGSVTVIQTRGTEKTAAVDGSPMARSNDGTAVYSDGDYVSYVWRPGSTSVRTARKNNFSSLVAVSNDGKLLTGLNDDGRLVVYGETDSAAPSGKILTESEYEIEEAPVVTSKSGPLAVFGTGKDVVFAAADGSVVRADASGTIGRLGKASKAAVTSLRASADGTMVAVSREGRGFTVYDTKSGKAVSRGEGQALSVVGSAGELESVLALDGRQAVRYDGDGKELTSSSLPSELDLSGAGGSAVEASADGQLLVARSGAKELALVDTRTGLAVRTFKVSKPDPRALVARDSVVVEDVDTNDAVARSQSRLVGLRSRAYLDKLADELLEGRELSKEEKEQLGE